MARTRLGITALAACAAIITALCPHASAGLSQFQGRWRNTNLDTAGITSLEIRVVGSTTTVEAWSGCEQSACDWGRVGAVPYGPTPSGNVRATAGALAAQFHTVLSETLVIIEPSGAERLSVQVFTRFLDTSGRAPYFAVYTFDRVRADRPAPAFSGRILGAI